MLSEDTYDKKISPWLYPLLILSTGLGFFIRLPKHMDILFSDEGNYFLTARNFFGKIDLNFGPLYSLWIKGWSLFIPDFVRLYYFNAGLLSVLTPLLVYYLLKRLSFSAPAACFAALSFLFCTLNVTLWPHVSQFSMIVILGGILLSFRAKERSTQLQIIALSTLVASYARPEYFMFSLFFLLLSFYFLWKEKRNFLVFQTGFVIGIFALIILFFHTPVNRYDHPGNYHRTWLAFIQHYFLREELQGKHFDFWWLSSKDFYWFGKFKDSHGSVFKFITLHPGQFAKHVLFNVKMYALQVFTRFLLVSNPFFSKTGGWQMLLNMVLFLGNIILLAFHKPTRSHIAALLRKNKFNLLVLFVLILPSLASSFIILPRDHYIFLQLPVFVLATGIYAENLFFNFPKAKWALAFIAIACMIFHSPGKYPFIKAGLKAEKNTNVQLVRFLEDSIPKKSYQVFTDNLYLTGLLPERFTEPTLMEYSFDFKNFSQFLSDKHVNMLLLTQKTNTEPYLRRDAEWNKFLADPSSIGYHRIYMGRIDSTYQLYVKD